MSTKNQQQERRIDPQRAVDFMLENSKRYAQAKANRVHIEQFRKSKKALLMNQCTEKAFAAKERCSASSVVFPFFAHTGRSKPTARAPAL